MIPYIETHIEDACNLKCRGCSHFSPLAQPRRKDLQEFEAEFERLAEIEDIRVIRLMGGEPLLNPAFMEYLRIAREYFPASKIALVTNGILADRLGQHAQELRDLNISVTVSVYHIPEQREFAYSERHEKGQLYNISLDQSGAQDKGRSFADCDHRKMGCTFLRDGLLFPCGIAGTIGDFWRYFGLDWGFTVESMGMDIFTHTAAELEAHIARPCELCRFCDTKRRPMTYRPFERSRNEIEEWTI